MKRVITYIDGFNLYYGIKDARIKKGENEHTWRNGHLWLGVESLARRTLQVINSTLAGSHRTGNPLAGRYSLDAVQYFTARVVGPADKVKRQTTYIEALALLPGVTVIEGRFHKQTRQCYEFIRRQGAGLRTCSGCNGITESHTEKMTDVNIALAMLRDALCGHCDVILLISGDTDLVPVLKMIRALRPDIGLLVAFPPARSVADLQNVCDSFYTIELNVIRRSQMPLQVTTASGYVLTRPAGW